MVGWGLNIHGQCGTPSLSPVLETPEEVEALSNSQTSITQLSAGHCHSAAITSSGEVYLWGDGEKGRLGLGHGAGPVFQPERCESLVDRTQGIVRVALGRTHTYFLDASGHVWGCGTVRVRQPGANQTGCWKASMSGSVLYAEGRTVGEGMLHSSHAHGHSSNERFTSFIRSSSMEAPTQPHSSGPGWDDRNMYERQDAQSVSWHSMQLVPLVDHDGMRSELERTQAMFDRSLEGLIARDSASATWEREHGWPAFDGRDSDLLVPVKLAEGSLSSSDATPYGKENDGSGINMTSRTMKGSEAISLAATRSCVGLTIDASDASGESVLLSKDGLPYVLRPTTISNRDAAMLTGHTLAAYRHRLVGPCALLKSILNDFGGAVEVVAGVGFYAALTKSGHCVIWFDIGISAAMGASLEREEVEFKDNFVLRARGETFLAITSELPPLIRIAATGGQVHVSDGSSVWTIDVITSLSKHDCSSTSNMGQRYDDDSKPVEPSLTLGLKSSTPATAPGQERLSKIIMKGCPRSPFQIQRILQLPDEEVVSLSAGGSAVAAVTDAGRLWLWGSVLHPNVAAAVPMLPEDSKADLGSNSAGRKTNGWSAGLSDILESSQGTRWEGLGNDVPTVVPGLHQVKRIAFGRAHAIAEVL